MPLKQAPTYVAGTTAATAELQRVQTMVSPTIRGNQPMQPTTVTVSIECIVELTSCTWGQLIRKIIKKINKNSSLCIFYPSGELVLSLRIHRCDKRINLAHNRNLTCDRHTFTVIDSSRHTVTSAVMSRVRFPIQTKCYSDLNLAKHGCTASIGFDI